jgi:hypothetical protein
MRNKRLKMQFDERKRKLIISGTICSAKKRFSPVNLLSPDSIQEGEEKNISVVAQGIPLRSRPLTAGFIMYFKSGFKFKTTFN